MVFINKQEKVKGLLPLELLVSFQNKVQWKQSTLRKALQQETAGEGGDKQVFQVNDR